MTEKTLHTFRWIAFIPGAIIGGTLLGITVSLLPRLIFNEFIGDLIASACIGTGTTFVASWIAPSHKKKATKLLVYCLSVVFVLFIGFAFAVALATNQVNREFWAFVIYAVITTITMFTALREIDK